MAESELKGPIPNSDSMPKPEGFGTPRGLPSRDGADSSASKQKHVNPRGTDPTGLFREGQRKQRRIKVKNHLSPQTQRALATFVAKFGDALRRNQATKTAIQSDPQGFRADLLGLLRSQFPVRRGRHRDPRIDAACEMVRKGKTVQQALKAQIPGWRDMDPYTRMLAAKGLHHAIYRRRKKTLTKSQP